MLTYKDNLLVCKKFEDAPNEVLDLLADQKRSYAYFKNDRIKADIDFLVELLKICTGIEDIKFDLHSEMPLTTSGSAKEIKQLPPQYYSVIADITSAGVPARNVEVLRIPYMYSDGVINVKGNKRVMCMPLVAAPSITMTKQGKEDCVQVTLDNSTIQILLQKKAPQVQFRNKKKMDIYSTIQFLAFPTIKEDHESMFTNAKALSMIEDKKANATVVEMAQSINADRDFKETDLYYLSTSTREIINDMLSLDRCLGKHLSRPITVNNGVTYPEGSIVTKEMLTQFKRSGITTVYVRCVPLLTGYVLKNSIIFGDDVSNLVTFEAGVPLSREQLIYLANSGVTEVEAARVKTEEGRTYTFEQEIISNRAIRAKDRFGVSEMSEHLEAEAFIYDYAENSGVSSDYFNYYDFVALLSLLGYSSVFPEENVLPDKDESFRKRVQRIADVFSTHLRRSMISFTEKCKSSLGTAFSPSSTSSTVNSGTFGLLNKMWMDSMWEDGCMKAADVTNPLATLTQACQITSNFSTKNSVPKKVRMLAAGYYGRICPYETPASRKLGVVNTKAYNCKISDNGILKSPFCRVGHTSDGRVQISKLVEYLTVEEEAGHFIADRWSLQEGKKTGRVLARVSDKHGASTFETVDIGKISYVNAYAEQHLSPTAAMIPFAGCNDATRVTYATHMLKQSILIENAEKPRVFTNVYEDIFAESDMHVVRARKNGWVVSIDSSMLCVNYDDGTKEDFLLKSIHLYGKTPNFVRYKVKEGDSFNKGDILAETTIAQDGIYSPGVNIFVAYMPSGWNYEDADHLSKSAADKFISISTESVKKKVKKKAAENIIPGNENFYRYIGTGEHLLNLIRTRQSDSQPTSQEEVRAENASGILYNVEASSISTTCQEYKFDLLAFNRISCGDKIVGRHGNKGTTSICMDDSEMPMFKNGQRVELLFNPCGVPSRLNVGQNFEGFLGFVATLLDIHIKSNSFNGASKEEVELLMQFVYDLANTEDFNSVRTKYTGLLPEGLLNRAKERHSAIREWEGCFNPDGTAILYNPVTGKYFDAPATFGVSYVLKLVHEVHHKINARAGFMQSTYSFMDKQPTKGASKNGGQKIGEMEMWALGAYGTSALTSEILNEASDNVYAKAEQLRSVLLPDSEPLVTGPTYPYSSYVLQYFFEGMGIKVECDDKEFPPVDRLSVSRIKRIRPRDIDRPAIKASLSLSDLVRGAKK